MEGLTCILLCSSSLSCLVIWGWGEGPAVGEQSLGRGEGRGPWGEGVSLKIPLTSSYLVLHGHSLSEAPVRNPPVTPGARGRRASGRGHHVGARGRGATGRGHHVGGRGPPEPKALAGRGLHVEALRWGALVARGHLDRELLGALVWCEWGPGTSHSSKPVLPGVCVELLPLRLQGPRLLLLLFQSELCFDHCGLGVGECRIM